MRNNKTIVVISSLACLGLTTIAAAECVGPDCGRPPVCKAAGFVVGLQGGYARTHWGDILTVEDNPFTPELFPTITSSDTKDDGFAGRGYIGFDITPFFGIESGFTSLPEAETTFFFVDGTSSTTEIDNYAVDLLGKLILPVSTGFSLFAKVGGSYFYSSFSTGGSVNHLGLAYGVGAAYVLIPNFSVDLSWLHYTGDNQIFNDNGTVNGNYQPSPDAFFLGFSYKFPLHYYEL